ncbi:MAG TPA: SRPBCC family protein, partial [Candidatus Paceibacterota bacterium]|nr:SRPBCC family protein [Candidatus Paceibacterota bacterium]
KFLFCMHGTPGAGQPEIDMYDTGVFEEIVPMEKLVYTDSFADKDGNPVSPAAYGMPDMPDVMRVTIELEDAEGGKTKFSLRHDGAPAGQNGTNMQAGWGETLDKLEASLA